MSAARGLQETAPGSLVPTACDVSHRLYKTFDENVPVEEGGD